MRLQTVFAASLVAALPAMAQTTPSGTAQPGPGFFKPSADPALTAIRPAPGPTPAQPAVEPAVPAPAPAIEVAEQIRKEQERQIDRSVREHDRARARAAETAVGSPAAVAAGAPAEPGRY